MSVHYVDAFMRAALKEAELALEEGEVPVGCVLVRTDVNEMMYAKLAPQSSEAVVDAAPHAASLLHCDQLVESCIAARGRNQTNRQHHGLAHAEFIAVQRLIDDATRGGDASTGASSSKVGDFGSKHGMSEEGKENGLTSLLATEPLSSLAEYVLYVTVEPCVMCGAMLLYNRVAHVFFGCRNPRFGGNGTVLALHQPPTAQPQRLLPQHSHPDEPEVSASHLACTSERLLSANDGGIACSSGWWPGYVSEGGHTEAEAIDLLQRFYERENPNAPGHKRRRKA
ncbi:deaminase, putative [Leishmania tarentolae]|uniref:Deaminase, putative n=1 Tax=Leishmania tarentolae TaxID=5689 RepID=A0A640KGA8_LEITA|nr:deaminase, putative [Leishmania tarentolae]